MARMATVPLADDGTIFPSLAEAEAHDKECARGA